MTRYRILKPFTCPKPGEKPREQHTQLQPDQEMSPEVGSVTELPTVSEIAIAGFLRDGVIEPENEQQPPADAGSEE